MFSGTTLTSKSGSLVGTHQKINKVAYKRLSKSVSAKHFPELKLIQHFEGNNGPDAIKRKSPAKDEPWHFCNPNNPSDHQLSHIIETHYRNLVLNLRARNIEKAAFEASWLAHAMVDGLTPAHHFPYEEELAKLRDGCGNESRNSLREKLIIKGNSIYDTAQRNWSFWGAKGLFSTHSLFEWGVACIMATLRHKQPPILLADIQSAKESGITELFSRSADRIAELQLYESFMKRGWTPTLARSVRSDLIPEIIDVVTLAWANALHEAGMTGKVQA